MSERNDATGQRAKMAALLRERKMQSFIALAYDDPDALADWLSAWQPAIPISPDMIQEAKCLEQNGFTTFPVAIKDILYAAPQAVNSVKGTAGQSVRPAVAAPDEPMYRVVNGWPEPIPSARSEIAASPRPACDHSKLICPLALWVSEQGAAPSAIGLHDPAVHVEAEKVLQAIDQQQAKRYRWLRDFGHRHRVAGTASMSLGLGPYIRFDPPANNQFSGMTLSGEYADGVIDEAMKESK